MTIDVEAVLDLLATPFHDLLARAHAVHRERFDPHVVEGAMLLSIKTGGCPRRDRAGLLAQLAALDPHPESVPINLLVQVPGTPLHGTPVLDGIELVRTVAAARLLMTASVVRLSAGCSAMTDELQALCLHAGANSIFLGDRLLTTANPGDDHDQHLLDRLDAHMAPTPLLT